MDFELSDEHRQIRATVADFGEHEIKPYASEWDRAGIFPRQLVGKIGELGFLGVAFPEKYGGGGSIQEQALSRISARGRLTDRA